MGPGHCQGKGTESRWCKKLDVDNLCAPFLGSGWLWNHLWKDGQKTVTAPAEGMSPLSCSSRSWQGEGWGGAGHVRWLLELFPKQVGLTALRWGSVTLDMSQRSFLDLFCLLVRDLFFNIPSGSDIPRIWSAIISLNPSSIREVFLWVLESQ